MAIISSGVLSGAAIVRPFAGWRPMRPEVPHLAACRARRGDPRNRGRSGGAASSGSISIAGAASITTTYYGAVAGDDAQAVDVGRRILINGGNAADAAAAMGLTLTVTLPSRAGLDGGGLCLVHEEGASSVEEIDFLPPPAPANATAQIPGLGPRPRGAAGA